MANTSLKFGNGNWAIKENSALAYSDQYDNFKPLPFDFSRAGSGTIVNKEGLIETAGNGLPRIDFADSEDGALKLEPQSTNLVTYSEDFSDSSWANSNISEELSNVLSPDGTSYSYKLTNNAVTGNHFLRDTITVTSGQAYTLSIFIKKGTRDIVSIADGYNVNILASFDLTNGTRANAAATSSSIESFNNGWYRCMATITPSTTNLGLMIFSGTTYAGNDESGDFYVWGAQAEPQSFTTSYIPTQGSAVTRVADSCSQTLPSIVVDSYPFSVFAELDVVDTSKGYAFSLLKSTSSAEYFTIEYYANVWHITARPNGATERITSTTTVTKGTHKIVGVWESSSMKLYLNGSLIASGSNSQSFNIQVNSMLLGQLRISGDNGLRNTVRQTELYNTALTDQEAIALTQV